ncbi:AraC family transcriptional regulator [Tamlana crocina]
MNTTTLKEGFLGQKMIALPKSVIKTIKKNPITKSFYISDLGYYPTAHHHHRTRKKGAKQYIFIYCTKGKGEIRLNDTTTKISPNQFFILPKNAKHEYAADKKDPWSIYWFHFNGNLASKLYNRYASNPTNLRNIPFSAENIESFDKIFNLFDNNNLEHGLEFANILALNFISSFIYYNAEEQKELDQGDNVINAIREYLLSDLQKNHTLDHISERFNYSKSYLHTKFKKRTGYSIIVFHNLKKVQKACEYLIYTDLSIKEISFKVGFDDPLYFSRIFKKYMGKSPRKYKNGWQK